MHCLRDAETARNVLYETKKSLRHGGTYILVAFNDGPHDLSAHPGFRPLLLSHAWYLSEFNDWNVSYATDTILHETHPHNALPHFHSITRLIAQHP